MSIIDSIKTYKKYSVLFRQMQAQRKEEIRRGELVKVTLKCNDCNGLGYMDHDPECECGACHGSGEVMRVMRPQLIPQW